MSKKLDLKSHFDPHLARDETVIWWGKPSASSISLRSGLGCFSAIFILLVLLAVIVFDSPNSSYERVWFTLATYICLPCGTIFALCYFISGFLDESRQIYVLTDRRIIILAGRNFDKIYSFFSNNIHSLETIKTLDYGHIKIWTHDAFEKHGWKGFFSSEEFSFDTLREIDGYQSIAEKIHAQFALKTPIRHRK